ncbi:hypothetical protein C0J52_16287 [Blattella germanica]|nr:hypothetical protein C0J52_16287 [Blattella germanica]
MELKMLSILTLAYFLMCVSMSLSMEFPILRSSEKLNVRLQNLANKSYLSVMKNDNGELKLNFKHPLTDQDPEVVFTLYFYTAAESAETKFIFLVHAATSSCMNVTSENNIQMIPLKNTTDGVMEDPMKFTMADSRFLHISTSGTYYALNFLIGKVKDVN